MPDDTIYAVSSGRPPAAIAVMRISGPRVGEVLTTLAGRLPEPRVATLRSLRLSSGDVLDRALALWFPGPASATGEDLAELHLHGGVAIVAAVSHALADAGLRQAEPGEFTRRGLLNGRLDLNEVEALADLLAAETETQRREAMARADGALARELDGWTTRLLEIAADLERSIDHDEDDIGGGHDDVMPSIRSLLTDIETALARPHAAPLHDGIRVAIVGPVNAGKSSLFNALLGTDAAIVSPFAGTTRDTNERTVSFDGVAFRLTDTAGERETSDPIETIGIERARNAAQRADIIIDLTEGASDRDRRIAVAAKADIHRYQDGRLAVSSTTGFGLPTLVNRLTSTAANLLPAEGDITLSERVREGLNEAVDELGFAAMASDSLLVAEHVASARRAFDVLSGHSGTDALLDTLFARFCLGK